MQIQREKDKMTEEKYKLNKKDFIPVYGLIKYIGRTMPAKINNNLEFKENIKIEFNQCMLGVYNLGVIGVATVAAMAATAGLEGLLK
jgi:hypothetical protein